MICENFFFLRIGGALPIPQSSVELGFCLHVLSHAVRSKGLLETKLYLTQSLLSHGPVSTEGFLLLIEILSKDGRQK